MFASTMSNSTSLSEEASVSSTTRVHPEFTCLNPLLPSFSDVHHPPQKLKKKRSLPGNPDPDAEVIALSPKTLLATNRFVCEICNKGFQRDQNLQLHRRGHNLPWKLKQRNSKEVKKKAYVCPEPSCVHHHPSRALGDLTGIKKHYCRKHGEKKWKCDKCSKVYAVQSDWKAHSKTCGTREYRCDCGTLFSRKDSFITHRAFCDALAEESARLSANQLAMAAAAAAASGATDININSSSTTAADQSLFPYGNHHQFSNSTLSLPPPPPLSQTHMSLNPWDHPQNPNPNHTLQIIKPEDSNSHSSHSHNFHQIPNLPLSNSSSANNPFGLIQDHHHQKVGSSSSSSMITSPFRNLHVSVHPGSNVATSAHPPHIDLLHVKAYKKEYKPKPKPQPLISLQPNHRIEFKKMGSIDQEKQKPHAVFIPFPAQGHVSPMLKLAKLFHHKGFHITFVNTEYNHRRLLRSRGPNSLDGLPDFHFRTIPDGLPPSDGNATQHVPSLCYSTAHNCLAPFCNLISEINSSDDLPPVSCIISDGIMTFTFFAARQFEIPVAMFWTASACGYLGYMQYDKLVKEGLVPFKDENFLTNGDLETTIEWIPPMEKIRLRDIPSFIRTTDKDDIMLNFFIQELETLPKANAIIMNTFDSLEHHVLEALSSKLPPIYPIGPINSLVAESILDEKVTDIRSNLWNEQSECMQWLDSQKPNSVVYVNFGSVTVMSPEHLVEFAWGLANSGKSFLWIVRPDLVEGKTAVLPAEFVAETKGRGMLANWCNQEEALKHPSVGGFLTHNGWNSTMESIVGGVAMISWPFFAEQQTNCRYCKTEWGNGLEIGSDVKREEVEKLVRELMDGEKGEDMRRNAKEWKRKAEEACKLGGPSSTNLDRVISEILLVNNSKK